MLALFVGIGAFAVYLFTLTPSVAPGDVAELQYIPSRLGIPHPNGFPFYLLLAKAWSLLPLGSLAWRMNLLSAIMAALGVVALYAVLRIAGLGRVAGVVAALFWAFQRTYWLWATLADRYTLLLFLILVAFGALLRWRHSNRARWLWLAALAYGCSWVTHISAPLYGLPIALLLLWPKRVRTAGAAVATAERPGKGRRLLALAAAAGVFLAPLLLYAYVPLRGAHLWRTSAVDLTWGQPAVVLHGLVHPRFQPDAATTLAYFRAGNPINPATLLADLILHRNDLVNLVKVEFGLVWLMPALAGLLLALRRNRAWGAALLVLLVADTVLAAQYWQGNVEAYFLPALLVLTVGLGEAAHALVKAAYVLSTRAGMGRPRVWLAAPLTALLLALPLAPLLSNAPGAVRDESRALSSYWRMVLALPLEPQAGLLAHWSDLTSFWYFQQAEGRRPDLQGLYLPEIERLHAAVDAGRAIYLSGPLSGWYPDLAARVQLVPWGPLVRLHAVGAAAPNLPTFDWAPADVSFGGVVALQAASLPGEPVEAGQAAQIVLSWRSLAALSRDQHVSLRLRRAGVKHAQLDDRLVSAWFPSPQVDGGLHFWSRHHLPIPLGLAEGDYEVVLVTYDLGGPELTPSTGESEVRIGALRVRAEGAPAHTRLLAPTLGPCLQTELAKPLSLQATVGALVDFELLLVKRCQPTEDQGLRFVLAGAGVTRALVPGDDQALSWRPGGYQRERIRLRVPPDVAAGRYEIRVEALDPRSGRAWPRYLGPVPLPSQQVIGALQVNSRPVATEVPKLSHPLDVLFDNGLRLLGVDRSTAEVASGAPITLTLAWRAEQPVAAHYQVFLHLLRADGSIAAQRDAAPGELPTPAWLPGEVVTATHTLAAATALPPGEYRLIAGLYNPATMQRALVKPALVKPADGSSPADHVELGIVRLAP